MEKKKIEKHQVIQYSNEDLKKLFVEDGIINHDTPNIEFFQKAYEQGWFWWDELKIWFDSANLYKCPYELIRLDISPYEEVISAESAKAEGAYYESDQGEFWITDTYRKTLISRTGAHIEYLRKSLLRLQYSALDNFQMEELIKKEGLSDNGKLKAENAKKLGYIFSDHLDSWLNIDLSVKK